MTLWATILYRYVLRVLVADTGAESWPQWQRQIWGPAQPEAHSRPVCVPPCLGQVSHLWDEGAEELALVARLLGSAVAGDVRCFHRGGSDGPMWLLVPL